MIEFAIGYALGIGTAFVAHANRDKLAAAYERARQWLRFRR